MSLKSDIKLQVRDPFFLLPAFVYIGVAGQLSGLILVGIIWAYFHTKESQNTTISKHVFFLGLTFIGSWLLFPLSDLINSLWGGPDTLRIHLAGSEQPFIVYKSQLPSSWLVTGIALICISLRNRSTKINDPSKTIRTFENSFYNGLIIFSVLFCVYFVTQYITGFDYRRPDLNLGPANQLNNGLYRVFGLYGHTLSFSSVGLAMGTFFAAMHTREQRSKTLKYKFFFLAILHYFFVFIGGGRVSSIIAGLVSIAWLIYSFRHKIKMKYILVNASILSIVLGLLFYGSGIFSRLLLMLEKGADGQIGINFPRMVFWKVHWNMFLDSPLIGHGAGRLREFVLTAYYQISGFGSYFRQYNAHNIYLETLANIGLIGFFSLLALLALGWNYLKQLSSRVFSSDIRACFIMAVLANAMHGLTQNVFFDANVMSVYLVLFWFVFWVHIVEE